MTAVRKRWLAVLAVVFVGTVLAVMLWPREKEPVYQGRKLSQWISRGYDATTGTRKDEAASAVRAIGTNALPFLLKWIQDGRVSRWHRYAFWIAGRLPGGRVRDRMFDLATDDVNSRRATYAIIGFHALGTNAGSAVPALARVLRSNDKDARYRAALALGSIGKEGLPPLLAAAQDEHYDSRAIAVQGLCQLRVPDGSAEARVAVQFLVDCLRDENPEVSGTVAGCMPEREFALTVPALIEFAKRGDFVNRFKVLRTFERFGTNALPAALPMLMAGLEDEEPMVRDAATNVLAQIAPEELQKLK